jgi:hypothetical protein
MECHAKPRFLSYRLTVLWAFDLWNSRCFSELRA